ncbi:uncharacterized protein JCM6883_005702 [Sporobolomyces salmoneus]|uniref:uncharacterized protein n=1 Tax=Sporobolomyces salmoneus TaxID=183962 RepID=UPI00317AB8FB
MSFPTSSVPSPSLSPSSSATLPERSPNLSLKEIGDANRRAQLDGVAAGTCAGFLSGFLSTKGLKMSRNVGLLSGLISGVFVGYVFTQESLKLQLKKATLSNQELRKHLSEREEVWDLSKGERGVNGMEGFEDKYASTRGDH